MVKNGLTIGACVIAFMSVTMAARAQSPSKAPSYKAVVADACARAKKEGKQLFLMFGASWCVPCHMAEEALRQPRYANILGKYYLFVKIDVYDSKKRPDLENEGAEDEIPRIFGEKSFTLPDYAILDSNGNLRANFRVDVDGQQIHVFPQQGYPHIGAYLRMLHAATPKFTMKDFVALRKVLEEDDKVQSHGPSAKSGG